MTIPVGVLRRWFGAARIVAALTAIVALVGEVNFTIGTSPFAISNFFSYFTVESMIIATVVFGLGAINALKDPEDPLWLDMARALATTYVVVSGFVFAFILLEGTLRGVPVWAPWSSQLLHFVLPVYALLDWTLAPGREVPWKTIGWAMVFPAAWLAFTLFRGAQVYWYPYFFLDPALVAIPFELALYLGIVMVIFASTVAMLIGISRRHHSRATARALPDRGTARGSQAPPRAARDHRTPKASAQLHPR